jgi:MATE family multidrug resistance protein
MSGEWRKDVRPTVMLAGPVVLGQLGMMLMNLVDTALVGRLGSSAVASVAVATSVFMVPFMFGLGMLQGLDRVVAFASGAGRPEDVRRALVQGQLLALGVSLPGIGLTLLLSKQLHHVGVEAEVLTGAQSYLSVLSWSLWPALAFTAIRQSLQGLGQTRVATVTTVVANAVNYGGNLLFIEGHAGVPAMGIVGSAWATFVARLFMLVVLAWHARGQFMQAPLRPEPARLMELLRLGVPGGLHLVVESGVFAFVTLLAARISATSGAAHQIVLQVASFTFMIPLGISAAGAVRVGNALGRRDVVAARRAGWVATGLGVAAMSASAVLLLAFGPLFLSMFRPAPEVMEVAKTLLVCAGLFQVFDGAQAVLSGVLRGAGDTASSMAANLVGHWAIGLPVGAALCYRAAWGVTGLWIGLAVGLAMVACALAFIWHRRLVVREVETAVG